MSDSEDSHIDDLMNKEPTFDFQDPSTIHDRVLIVEGIKFYVQSGYLSVWSTYFRTLFNSHFKENKEEIELKEVSAEDFGVFLQAIYPGSVEIQYDKIEALIELSFRFSAPACRRIYEQAVEKEFHLMNKIELFKVADKHGMKDLKLKALENIKNNIQEYNPIKLLKFAFQHNLEDLKKKIRCFIYSAYRQELGNHCKECPERIQRTNCTHIPKRSMPITRNSVMAEYINEIIDLPENIKNYVLGSTLSYI